MRLRSLLRGSCFGTVIPWGLASFYRVCGGGAGLVLPGSCSPRRFPASVLMPGLGPAASSVAFRPFPSLGSVRRSVFGFRLHFLGISRFRVRLRLIPFSSSSSLHLSARALLEERVGVLVWVFIHQPPCLLILQHGSQVGHTGSPSLLSYNLLLFCR